MNLQERLAQDLKEAMKSGDETRRDTIRTLRATIKYAEIEAGQALSDKDVMAVVAKQAKQRRDSIEQFQRGNRMDLVEQEQKELNVITTYLPKQLTDDDITVRAKAAIAEMGVTDIKGMGKVMSRLSKEMKGLADGKRISDIVRRLLAS